MSFADLYHHVEALRHRPVVLERDVVPFMLKHTAQDEILFVPVDLDPEVSFGHIKQFRVARSVYDHDPIFVTQVRFYNKLNMCWRRFVCTKELMHVYDSDDEKTNTEAKLRTLLGELESQPLPELASPMYVSENITKWMALAVLCPMPLRDYFRGKWREELSDYEVALELRVPEDYIPAIMSEDFPKVVQVLLERSGR